MSEKKEKKADEEKTVAEIEKETGEVNPEPKAAQAARLGRKVIHDWIIRGVTIGIVVVIVVFAAVAPSAFTEGVDAVRLFVTEYCSWWIVLASFLCLAVSLYIALSRYGKIRLGGKDAKPAFSYFSWFAMLFATGQGVGLVFWAVAEPIMMYGGSPNTPFEIQDSMFAGDMALAWTYFHWAIPAWAIYCIISLFLAYSRYNMHKDTTIRGTIENLFPQRAGVPVGIICEILVVFATVFGLTTSLGLASYQFNSGIQEIFQIETPFAFQVGCVILFGVIATLSVWLGVVKGIRNISNFNAIVSIVLIVAVFIFGPTMYILGVLPESVAVFIDQFWMMTGFTEAVNLGGGIETYGESWETWWSFFIFCWCFAFGTFTAGFVSTISRGRTLREFVFGVVFVPAIVCIIWTCVVGGAGIWASMSDPSIVDATNADSSMGLFLTLGSIDSVPYVAFILTIIATLLIAGYIVTSVDSGVMALSSFVSPAAKESRAFKAVLALSITALAVIFMLTAGEDFLDTVQFATIAGGVPFSIVVVLMGVQFFKWVKHDEQLVELGEATPFPEDSREYRELKAWHEEMDARIAEDPELKDIAS